MNGFNGQSITALQQKTKEKGVKEMKKLIRFLKDEEGVTALEYSLIAALIAVVIITAVQLAGTEVSDTFSDVASALSAS